MKKTISLAMALLFVLPMTFAEVKTGDRISVYDEADAVVGDRGYVDLYPYETENDVFVCATKDKKQVSYGMNLNNDGQIAKATELVKSLLSLSFDRFDSYGCLRAKI